MANTVISPNMNLPVPVVSVDPGPDWATNVDACLNAIDSHNHTTGQGVPITPTAININTDLPMNNNNLITARSVRFQPQTIAISNPADLGCLFEQGVDLYYIDGSGNLIRLTQSGAPAGATGTITGLPSGTASASFAGTTFTFQSATSTPASLAVGPTTIAQAVPSGFGVTLTANAAEAVNYGLTLPVALPSVDSAIVSDNAGNLSFQPFLALATGTYAPIITALTNCTVTTPGQAMYMRVGNHVMVNGTCDVDPIGGGFVDLTISFPIASTLGVQSNCTGGMSGIALNSSNTESFIAGNTSTNTAQVTFDTGSFSNSTIWYWFQYIII